MADDEGVSSLSDEQHGFCARILAGVRGEAVEAARDGGVNNALDLLMTLMIGLGELAAAATRPGFTEATEAEVFAEMLVEADGPYYCGTSLADTLAAGVAEAFDDGAERVAAIGAAIAFLEGARAREREETTGDT